MRQISGLGQLLKSQARPLNKTELAELVKIDLTNCRLCIYGQFQGQVIVIAEMQLIEDGLSYDQFDERMDIIVAGEILATDVPLNYALRGRAILITGRCSLLAQVCGADLLLNKSFAGALGDQVRQKFSIPLKQLSRQSTF